MPDDQAGSFAPGVGQAVHRNVRFHVPTPNIMHEILHRKPILIGYLLIDEWIDILVLRAACESLMCCTPFLINAHSRTENMLATGISLLVKCCRVAKPGE